MTVKEMQILIERQEELAQEYTQWESMQTDYSYDEELCNFCQWKMQFLDEEADKIQGLLEGRWDK